MKKGILIAALLVPMWCIGQSDSTKRVFANGKALDSTLTYVSVVFEIFSTAGKTQTFWTSTWKGNDKTGIIKTDYGLKLGKLWDNMVKAAILFELKNYKGERLSIESEDDLFNVMAAHGYRFLMKTDMPPMNVGVMAARAYGGKVYKFEKK
jgi:hypothetical protein